MKYCLFIFIIFFSIILMAQDVWIEATVHELSKVLSGSYTTVRTIQLLNQLCIESQIEADEITRDACYGCFFKASNKPSGYPMLLSMVACSDLYLDEDSNYGHCSAYLKDATSDVESKSTPGRIYCTFLECIRQVNKDRLIKSCGGEAFAKVEGSVVDENILAQIFVNTTACILARTRCSTVNSITGASQSEDDLAVKLSIPTLNAILINSDYDMNIIQLPNVPGIVDECAKYRSIKQATWPGVNCAQNQV